MVSGKSNEIYQYGARALGREVTFLEREEGTTKEEFLAYIKEHIAQAAMCMGAVTGGSCGDKEIIRMAAETMLLDEKWFVSFSVTCYGQQIAARIPADCLQ